MGELEFIDPEIQTGSGQKIDFKYIIMKQIDTVRILRSQEMGEFILFEFKADIVTPDYMVKVVENINKYQNSVKSYMNLMKTYHDEQYLKAIKDIEKKYKGVIDEIVKRKKIQTLKANKNVLPKEFLDWKKDKIKELTLKHAIRKYDDIFQELLLLTERAKYIGGNDMIDIDVG